MLWHSPGEEAPDECRPVHGRHWLWFEKAAKYRFAGDVVTIDVSKGEPFAEVIEYKLSIQPAA
jgi:hypothetical protein